MALAIFLGLKEIAKLRKAYQKYHLIAEKFHFPIVLNDSVDCSVDNMICVNLEKIW